MNLRKLSNTELNRISKEQYRQGPESGIAVILDNIRSAHNVGSVFRSSDAFKVDKILICGISATPPNAEIHKTALGAESVVAWRKYTSTMEAIEELRKEGYTIVSVEQTENSLSLEDFCPLKDHKYAFIYGNEVDGVGQSAVDASDFSIEIPQLGTKHSLNISVAAGITLWHTTYKRIKSRDKESKRTGNE